MDRLVAARNVRDALGDRTRAALKEIERCEEALHEAEDEWARLCVQWMKARDEVWALEEEAENAV